MRKRILRKSIAIFLLLVTVGNVVAPTVSYALTSGPTAPEATSFEPVDTTDMVNLATGDMTYNIPLLEVPGPAGGYPLSLSYHAGLMTNEEASWTGLGWTLNPGSITRSVNGFADDFKDVANSNRFYWEGGEKHIVEIGATMGVAGVVGVTAGVSLGFDTYQGFGVGAFQSWDLSLGVASVNASLGVDPWGNFNASSALGLGYGKATKFGFFSVGWDSNRGFNSIYSNGLVSTDFNSVTVSALGISMTTRNGQNSLTVGGGSSSVSNSSAGRISTSTFSITPPLPLLFLNYTYMRYWIDETETTYSNGLLHFPTNTITDNTWFDSHVYDTYSLATPDTFVENLDPHRVNGGTYPGADDYMVNAQGIFGNMKPQLHQRHLVTGNTKHYNNAENRYDWDIIQYQLGNDTLPIHFRFVNDFSNKYIAPSKTIDIGNTLSTALSHLSFINPSTGENQNDGILNNKLVGTRDIEYYTNGQIKSNGVAFNNFIETRSSGFNRTSQIDDQIGAFSITNASGVRYHFSLPAYASSEFQYSENINKAGGDTFNQITKDTKYAYTWYLTGITGPDYVDRGNPGLDQDDWGYWVEFEYGKWSDFYMWRSPGEGMDQDLDRNFKNYSEGRKEVYYLDLIRTKSHTAIFSKSIRDDAKSTNYSPRNKVKAFGKVSETSSNVSKNGGFTPASVSCSCVETELDGLTPIIEGGTTILVSKPTSSLKLDKIYLIKNDDLNSINLSKSNGIEYQQNSDLSWNITSSYSQLNFCGFQNEHYVHHLYQNVIDKYDIQLVESQLTASSIRVIKFETSQSLVPETPNSFSSSLVNATQPSTNSADYPRNGKLTLDAIRFMGKGGADLTPPTRFSYELDNPNSGQATISKLSGSPEKEFLLNLQNGVLSKGDIIKFTSNNKPCYALITNINASPYSITILGTNNPISGLHTWVQTKNPPYNVDTHDHWGSYKPDFKDALHDNISRVTTQMAAMNSDVWSLRTITSPQGSKIKISYSSDVYSKAVLYRNGSFIISSFSDWNNQNGTVNINLALGGINAGEIFSPGNAIDFSIMWNSKNTSIPDSFTSGITNYSASIVEVGATSIKISLPWFVDYYNNYNTEPDGPLVRQIYGGNVFLKNDVNMNGGGIRVDKVEVTDMISGASRATTYDYRIPLSELSSGVTSYEPVGINKYSRYSLAEDSDLIKDYKRTVILGRFSNLLLNARNVPVPGVMYEYVTVKELVTDENGTTQIPGQSMYQFDVFNEGMVGYISSTTSGNGLGQTSYAGHALNNNYITVNNIELRDYTSFVGNLKKTTLFDSQLRKISETTNHYLHDQVNLTGAFGGDAIRERYMQQYDPLLETKFGSQGVLEENYATARFSRDTRKNFADFHNLIGVVSRYKKLPSVPTGQTTVNFKTGFVNTSSTLKFDFYSGQVTKSISTDGYGNTFANEVVPAYRVYDAMRPSALGGKNMLTQEAANYSYKVNSDYKNNPVDANKIALVSASAQTWSNQIPVMGVAGNNLAGAQEGIWRKKSSFSYIGDQYAALPTTGDGLIAVSTFQPFTNWVTDVAQSGWQKNETITKYDYNSHAIEATDMNDKYAATKFSYDHSQVLATAANANYRELAYSGVEESLQQDQSYNSTNFPYKAVGGGVYVSDESTLSSVAHTGVKSVQTPVGKKAFRYSFAAENKNYQVSVWASRNDAKIKYKLNNGVAQEAIMEAAKKSGDWYLLTGTITTGATGSLEIWCEATAATTLFDDFRMHPVLAAMTSYVYNNWGELTHILDNNNIYTKYEYDGMGRLTKTYRERLQPTVQDPSVSKITEVAYNYSLNNPARSVQLSFTKSGPSGNILPEGAITTPLYGEQTISFLEQCPLRPALQDIIIDGCSYGTTSQTVTIPSGTILTIAKYISDGSTYTYATLKNIQGLHKVQAVFGAATLTTPTSRYECEKSGDCNTGRVLYITVDACGNQTTVVRPPGTNGLNCTNMPGSGCPQL